jgi:hypothetical protein
MGRRWYRAPAGRVRTFGGLGLLGSLSTLEVESDIIDEESTIYGLGVRGELGAAIFFDPKLSLGARWSADLTGTLQKREIGTLEFEDVIGISTSLGTLAILGAFYF